MTDTRAERLAPLAGVVFAVLFAFGFLLSGDTPDTKATGEKIISHYKDTGSLYVSLFALVLAGILLLLFAGALRDRLRAFGNGWLATASIAGAAVYTAGLGIFGMHQFALIDAAKLGQPQVAQALNILDNDNFLPAVLGLGAMMLATGLHGVLSRSLPVWLAWAGIVLGVLTVAGPAGIAAFLLFPLWVLVVSITIYRSGPVVATEVAP